MTKKIKIFIADDNLKFIEGLVFMLSKTQDFEYIGSSNTGNELFKNPLYNQADVILLDIEMPGLNGFETAKKLNWLNPQIKLVAITMYQDKIYLEKLVSCGFRGFANKSEVTELLIPVIKKVVNNEFVFPDHIGIK